MKKCWLTEYKARNGTTYGAWVFAKSEPEAAKLCRRRGLREKVTGYFKFRAWPSRVGGFQTPASVVLRSRKSGHEKVHSVTFLAFLGIAAKVLTPREAIDDTGLLHEVIHVLDPLRFEAVVIDGKRVPVPRGLKAAVRRSEPSMLALSRWAEKIERRIPGYWP